MGGVMMRAERGQSEVIGIILMVAIVVILASATAVAVFVYDSSQSPAPQVSLSHSLVDDGGDRVVAVTLESGTSVQIDKLYVIGSVDLDIGGAPDSGTPANEDYASELEKFTESSGPNPQVGIGDTWESGETVYLDPVGSAEGVTISLYWNTRPIQGVNPGSVKGEDSYKIAEFTV
jgi:flagellin-like protein